MSTEALNTFNTTGYAEDALKLIKALKNEGRISEVNNIGLILTDVFFNNLEILEEVAECLIKDAGNTENKRVLQAHVLYQNFLNRMKNLTEDQAVRLILAANKIADHPQVQNAFLEYNKARIDAIMNRPKRVYKIVTFTITTCKRFDLFEQTMNSFINCCNDFLNIDDWICVDDLSSDEDRAKMKRLYPFFEFINKEYSQQGHPTSMNLLRERVNTPYMFHIEDDWRFYCERSYILDCLDVLTSNPTLGQCLVNRNYAEVPRDIDVPGGFWYKTRMGNRYYIHEHAVTDQDKENYVQKYGNKPNSSYWPHFSFRPSLVKKHIIDDLGEFNTNKNVHFEMEYADRYVRKGYKSAFLESIYCKHIGKLTTERDDPNKLNAYDLNNQHQFGKKRDVNTQQAQVNQPEVVVSTTPSATSAAEEKKSLKIAAVVMSLDRRPDRFEQFKNRLPMAPNTYSRFPAIDGIKLKSNVDLCRVFENNDYNMRSGMVGCAMTHLKLWTDLLRFDQDALIIFEDDAEFCNNFMECLQHIIATSQNCDVIFLGHHLRDQFVTDEFKLFNTHTKELPVLEKWDVTTSLSKSMGGAFAYVIFKSGAKKLIDFINENGMTNGVDTVMQRLCNMAEIYYCRPHLVKSKVCNHVNDSTDSDIQKDFSSLSLSFSKKMKLEREFYKNIELTELSDMELDKDEQNYVCELTNIQVIELRQKYGDRITIYNLDGNYYTVSTSKNARPKLRVPIINNHYLVDHMITY